LTRSKNSNYLKTVGKVIMYKNNKRVYKNILKMCAVGAKKRKEKKKIVVVERLLGQNPK